MAIFVFKPTYQPGKQNNVNNEKLKENRLIYFHSQGFQPSKNTKWEYISACWFHVLGLTGDAFITFTYEDAINLT